MDTHKLKQKGILPEGPNTASKAQHRHDTAHHHEQPHGVEAPQVRQRGDVGQHALRPGSRGRCKDGAAGGRGNWGGRQLPPSPPITLPSHPRPRDRWPRTGRPAPAGGVTAAQGWEPAGPAAPALSPLSQGGEAVAGGRTGVPPTSQKTYPLRRVQDQSHPRPGERHHPGTTDESSKTTQPATACTPASPLFEGWRWGPGPPAHSRNCHLPASAVPQLTMTPGQLNNAVSCLADTLPLETSGLGLLDICCGVL